MAFSAKAEVLFGFAQHLLFPILGGDVAPGQAQPAIDNNAPEVKRRVSAEISLSNGAAGISSV